MYGNCRIKNCLVLLGFFFVREFLRLKLFSAALVCVESTWHKYLYTIIMTKIMDFSDEKPSKDMLENYIVKY